MKKKRYNVFIRLSDASYREFEFNTEEEINRTLEQYKDQIVENETLIEDRLKDKKQKWKKRLRYLLIIVAIIIVIKIIF